MTEPHSFPPPWRVVELDRTFRVEDANGRAVATLSFDTDANRHGLTGRLSRDEAWQVALRVAIMPDVENSIMGFDAESDEARGSAPRPEKR